ncbi:Acyltransferase family protein [Microbulbifer donghaiensis]|uniref:Acyltransferase family protein n=2 Tax=Microbulbifer donghaiensis TaxID=494016 RepID=A0A1M4ZYK4_9GAMM|nr:Acyltransferase family protein [Microbulbifer donghaiensis]
MFLGVLVHSSYADYGTESLDIIRFISDSFRMACFFVISGYFSAMIYEKQGTVNFYANRMPLLLIPALFCTTLLVPITNHWMHLYFSNYDSSALFISGWMGHTWFLYVLLLYTLVTPIIVIGLRMVSDTQGQGPSGNILLATLFILIVFGSIASLKILHKFGHLLPLYETFDLLLSATFIYLPYFVLGIYMRLNYHLFNFAHKYRNFWLPLAIGLIIYRYSLADLQLTNTVQHIFAMSVDYVTAIAISFALFSLTSHYLKKPNSTIRLLSDSSYTVYILHFIVIAAVLLFTQKIHLPISIRFSAAAVIATFAGVLIHILLVRRYWIIKLILNGRKPLQWPFVNTPESKSDLRSPH